MEKFIKINDKLYKIYPSIRELTANERNVKLGDVRVINNIMFYAYHVCKTCYSRKQSVIWKVYNPSDYERFDKEFGQ